MRFFDGGSLTACGIFSQILPHTGAGSTQNKHLAVLRHLHDGHTGHDEPRLGPPTGRKAPLAVFFSYPTAGSAGWN